MGTIQLGFRDASFLNIVFEWQLLAGLGSIDQCSIWVSFIFLGLRFLDLIERNCSFGRANRLRMVWTRGILPLHGEDAMAAVAYGYVFDWQA